MVLQTKLCKGGWCNLEGWSRLLRISLTQKTTYIHLQEAPAAFLPWTPKPYVTHSKTLYPQIPWMELNHFAIGHAHFQLEIFFAKSQKLENLLFRTPPWDFVQSAWNLACTLFSWMWSKVIKRSLLGRTSNVHSKCAVPELGHSLCLPCTPYY